MNKPKNKPNYMDGLAMGSITILVFSILILIVSLFIELDIIMMMFVGLGTTVGNVIKAIYFNHD